MEPRPLVSALLLTIGEKTFEAAYDALKKQTIPFHQIVVIKNVSPFSSAFNEGVSKITTPFFIECDADMILDRNCAEVLMSKITPTTGMVIGHLRDPLQGSVMGVKLYRTDCCRRFSHENHFNCEYIFYAELLENNWTAEIIDKKSATLGVHRADITDPVYHFERFKYLGVKIFARKAWWDFTNRLIELAQSQEKNIAVMSVMAMVCGFYLYQTSDHLKAYAISKEYHLWQKRLRSLSGANKKSRVFSSCGAWGYFAGYWDGIGIRMRWKKLNMEAVMRECICSNQYPKWAYFLGLCSSIMNFPGNLGQNLVARFLRIAPFLLYLKKKLLNHINETNQIHSLCEIK